MEKLFCKAFRFKATRYEEWQAGQCISSGNCDTQISAIPFSGCFHSPGGHPIVFQLENDTKVNIVKTFHFLSDYAYMLHDRIQYAVQPNGDPNKPCVCHLFFNCGELSCVRFAMTSPDRIVEYYGEQV